LLTLKNHLDQNQTHYYTFHPKAEKLIKAVIWHLPGETPAEDIANKLLSLEYNVHNVRQMTTSRLESEGGSQTQALPLFLITLEWDKKSQQIFKLTHLNHVSIQVEAYRALTGLKQWYNCQQFGHVWAPCKQPPHCWWCGGGHRHKECPEKDNKNSSPSCCNCNLAERERQYPRLQVGQGRNSSPKIPASSTQKCVRSPPAPPKNVSGRTITPRLINPSTSYTAALTNNSNVTQANQPNHKMPQEASNKQHNSQRKQLARKQNH